jgi:hypothetical protein
MKTAISIVLKKNARGLYPKRLSGDHAISYRRILMAANSGRALRFRGQPRITNSSPNSRPRQQRSRLSAFQKAPYYFWFRISAERSRPKTTSLFPRVSVRTSICARPSINLSSILELNTEAPNHTKMANVALLGSTGMVVRGLSALRTTLKDPS